MHSPLQRLIDGKFGNFKPSSVASLPILSLYTNSLALITNENNRFPKKLMIIKT